MKSLLRSHRRTKSAEVDSSSHLDLRSAETGSQVLRSSPSFQQMNLAYKNKENGSSQSLRKLNPMTFLRRSSYDNGRRNSAGSARTAPVLSLDECRDCGVIYGTRTHNWGYGREGSIIIQEENASSEEEGEVEVAFQFQVKNPDSVMTYDTLDTKPSQLYYDESPTSSVVETTPNLSEKSSSMTSTSTADPDECDRGDTTSLYSFEENVGVGRNRSVNYYKAMNLGRFSCMSSSSLLVEEEDLAYDNFLDEVNAVSEEFGDQLSFRSASLRSQASSHLSRHSSSSLRRRQSSVVRKKDNIITLYSDQLVEEDWDEWNNSGGIRLNSLTLTSISES